MRPRGYSCSGGRAEQAGLGVERAFGAWSVGLDGQYIGRSARLRRRSQELRPLGGARGMGDRRGLPASGQARESLRSRVHAGPRFQHPGPRVADRASLRRRVRRRRQRERLPRSRQDRLLEPDAMLLGRGVQAIGRKR